MKSLKLLLLSSLVMSPALIFSKPLFIITPDKDQVIFPLNMYQHRTSFSDYVVTNNTGDNSTVYFKPLTSGFTRVALNDNGACGMNSQYLAKDASCRLRVAYQSESRTQPISTPNSFACITPNYTFGCSALPPQTISIHQHYSSAMAKITTNSDIYDFWQNRTTNIILTNDSNVDANNIHVRLPYFLLGSTSADPIKMIPVLKAHQQITLAIPVTHKPTPNLLRSSLIVIAGANTNTIIKKTMISANALYVSNALFSKANHTKAITVYNGFDHAITDFQLQGHLTNGYRIIKNTCAKQLSANTTCQIDFIAKPYATDQNNLVLEGYLQHHLIQQPLSLRTQQAKLTIQQMNHAALTYNTDTQTCFSIINHSDFDLHHLQVTELNKQPILNWISANNLNIPAHNQIQECYQLIPRYQHAAHLPTTAIQIKSDHSNIIRKNILPNDTVSIAIDSDTSNKHLGYADVIITNNTTENQTLSDLSYPLPSNLTHNSQAEVTVCDSTGSNCYPQYASSCLPSSNNADVVLAPSGQCDIWFKGNRFTTLIPQDIKAFSTITGTATDPNNNQIALSLNINYLYNNFLYLSSFYLANGGSWYSRLDATDGYYWYSVSKPTVANVMIEYVKYLQGDLYISGDLSNINDTSYNSVARWDSVNWHDLDSGLQYYYIDSLGQTKILPGMEVKLSTYNDQLYAYGSFNTFDGNSSVGNIAMWDPQTQTWTAFKNGITNQDTQTYGVAVITAVNLDNDDIYIGGNFIDSSDADQTFQNIARWDATNKDWASLENGIVYFSNTNYQTNVNDIQLWNDKVYIAGQFDSAGSLPVANVASWDPTNKVWAGVGTSESDGIIKQLLIYKNKLYNIKATYKNLHKGSEFRLWDDNSQTWSTEFSQNAGSINWLFPYKVAIAGEDGVYLGGYYTSIDGTSANSIAKWTSGDSFQSLNASTDISATLHLEFAPSIHLAPY